MRLRSYVLVKSGLNYGYVSCPAVSKKLTSANTRSSGVGEMYALCRDGATLSRLLPSARGTARSLYRHL